MSNSLSGQLIMTFVTGVSDRAFNAAQRLIGNVSGGLAMATVAASAG